MNVLSLFTGIGGLDLGIKIACPAARVVCCVERDAYCRRVLAARMADGRLDACPIWDDVVTFDGEPWRGCVDCVAGGFPCQDLSLAGRREGIKRGNRSGLWYEFARIIGEVEPRYVFVENVGALVNGGLDLVLGSLADLGFAAEWGVVSAADVGAPHLRKRLFLLAHAQRAGREQDAFSRRGGGQGPNGQGQATGRVRERRLALADAASLGRGNRFSEAGREARQAAPRPDGRECGPVGYPAQQPQREPHHAECALARQEPPPDPGGSGGFPPGPGDAAGWREFLARYPEVEPAVRRNAARTAHRVDRLRALGNAVVPQQAALAWSLLWRRMEESRGV